MTRFRLTPLLSTLLTDPLGLAELHDNCADQDDQSDRNDDVEILRDEESHPSEPHRPKNRCSPKHSEEEWPEQRKEYDDKKASEAATSAATLYLDLLVVLLIEDGEAHDVA